MHYPELHLCTDNGAMVAALGSLLVRRGAPASDPAFPTTSVLDVRSVMQQG